MAGIVSEESAVGRSLEGISSGQHSQSGHALAEWRSSEQVENGIPSTSPPYWDTDDSDDDDDGPKPSELYGKYTWKIEKFSEINKRELRSNAFEVGGYKWYILIYPQGCDVCNHLSLFLCVANHDKLLPGWSHFAQFTIAVVNKDPKKSKYSDTLHRFWKKEHDWGWKKFMELSKVSDGFIDADTLIIKAQVQVIREKQDHPFRCLDCQYRRELVRVYLSNVEQICRRYVEDRRGKLGKLIEDKARWSSFCAFWLSMDQNARRRMSREKKDVILKVIVKQFFIEKEVTSTLVMDSLYSGLKALEGQSKCKNDEDKLPDGEDIPPPFVYVEKGTFLLVDDLMLLLERAAMEPLPPKDEKGPQNRTKDGAAGEDFNKDSIERDERRLTELGRRTVEIFVLAHIFSNKIEVAYQEAIALKRQEELIREEEAAWLVESEQKAKRGTADKEKKSKKKQGKQKRNNRKGKDKAKDEKSTIPVQVQLLRESPNDDRKDPFESQSVPEKHSNLEDVSDMSDSVECTPDMVQQDSEERDASPVNWDTDTSDFQPPAEASSAGNSSVSTVDNGADKRSSSVIDDSCSTCSTDSAPSVVINGLYKGNSFSNYKCQRSPKRGNNRRGKMASEETSEAESRTTDPAADMALNGDVSPSGKTAEAGDSVAAVSSLSDQTKWPDLNTVKKEDKAVLPQKEPSIKDQANLESPSKDKIASPKSPPRSPTSPAIPKPDTHCVKTSSNGPQQINRATKTATSEPVDKLSGLQVQAQPRLRLSGTRPAATVASVVQPAPTVTAPGWAGPDRPPVSHGYVTPSYRNAIMGNSFNPSSTSLSSRAVNASPSFSQQPSSAPARAPVPGFIPNGSETVGPNLATSGFSFNTVRPQRDASRSLNFDVRNFDPYQPMNGGSHELFPSDLPRTSGLPAQGGVGDEFPHLDIINDLLDDEQSTVFQGLSNGPVHLNRQLTYPTSMSLSGEVGSLFSSCRFERSRSYPDDGFQHDYFNSVRDYIPQANMSPYANGPMDELVPTQWQINGPDLPLLSMRGSGVDGYGYSMPDYSNLACRVSGYNMFWPSNGH